MIESFLVSLCMAVLEKILTKGSTAFCHYLALKNELEKNKIKAGAYEKIVNSNASREERRRAEDDLLS